MRTTLIVLLSALSFNVAAQTVGSMRNIYGGEDFYSSNGQYLGYSSPNVHGGRDFFPSQNYRNSYSYGGGNQGWYGYHGSGNSHLQDGYAIGAGLSQFFNAFRGNK